MAFLQATAIFAIALRGYASKSTRESSEKYRRNVLVFLAMESIPAPDP
jgi:hypothetical protein